MELVDPHPRFHRSFLAAVDEFVAAGEARYAGLAVFGLNGVPGDEFTREAIVEPAGFEAMVRVVLDARKPFAARPEGYVPWTELWMADGWAWAFGNGIEAPLYWRREAEGWSRFALDGPSPVAPAV